MMRRFRVVLGAALVVAAAWIGAPAAAPAGAAGPWDALASLAGEWVGEEGGAGGQGTTVLNFTPELEGQVLVRRHRAEYPATRKRIGTSEDDLLVVTRDGAGNPTRAILFDTEHHIIPFTVEVSPDGKTITFTSDPEAGVPRQRMVWVRESDRELSFTLSMASPQAPDEFRSQAAGKVRRK